MIVNKKQLSEIIGRSERTLTEWQEKGMPIQLKSPRGQSNQYDTAKVIEWQIQKALAGDKQETSKERKERLEGDRLELILAKESGEFIAREDIMPVWEGAVVAARSQFLLGVKKLKRDLDKKYAIDVDIKLLIDQVDSTLTKLAEYAPDSSSDVEVGMVEMGTAATA